MKAVQHPFRIGEIIKVQSDDANAEEQILFGVVLWREPNNSFGYRIKVRMAGVKDPRYQVTSYFRRNDNRWFDRGWDSIFVRIEEASAADCETFCREIPKAEQARLIEIERQKHLAMGATQ